MQRRQWRQPLQGVENLIVEESRFDKISPAVDDAMPSGNQRLHASMRFDPVKQPAEDCFMVRPLVRAPPLVSQKLAASMLDDPALTVSMTSAIESLPLKRPDVAARAGRRDGP
jgi:hypothetical protein